MRVYFCIMENAFLRQVADRFAGKSLQEYTFVFPNRRSGLFFLKHLGEMAAGPLFAPRVLEISRLMDYLSELRTIDDLEQIFRLWKIYSKHHNESIDDFMSWGRIILSDFNDVDQYMADASQLFANIKDLNALKSDTSILTSVQLEALRRIADIKEKVQPHEDTKRRYLDIWDSLYPLYTEFRESLEKDGVAYSGMQYRQVAESLRNPSESLQKKIDVLGKVVFVGFSAPSECEKALMRCFQKWGGSFYWDFYSDMIKAPQNRSSLLISKCLDEFPSAFPISSDGGLGKKDCVYNVVAASGAGEQALIASRILSKIKATGAKDMDIAIVVSDESLIIPLLEYLNCNEVNITMGYPLRASEAASFFFTLADLGLRSCKSGAQILFPGEILISILNHPYIKQIDAQESSRVCNLVLKSNLYMLDSETLMAESPFGLDPAGKLSQMLRLIAPKADMFEQEGKDPTDGILSYLNDIAEHLEKHLSLHQRNFLGRYVDILDRIKSSGIRFNKRRTLYSAIRSAVRTASVPFSGEPLKGVQIMGPLETRVLDFDKIIFMSFNEGTYPASGESSSSIPYFLREAFNLPTYKNENSISAYNFYRLIQRASEVYMIYDTSNTDPLKSKEESRFIKQLKYDFGVSIRYPRFKIPVPSSSKTNQESLVMTEEDRLSLSGFFSDLKPSDAAPRHFSASSLNAYIDCQRRFFFSKILGLSDEDELSDTVEANTFGSIYHYCMEHIYKECSSGGLPVDLDAQAARSIESAVRKDGYLDNLILRAFDSQMHVHRIEGQNLMIRDSVKKYIFQTLGKDEAKAEIAYRMLDAEKQISCETDAQLSHAYIKGVIDRLETCGGIPRICDYKTGKFYDKKDLESGKTKTLDGNIEGLLDEMFCTDKRRTHYHSVLFQLFFYALLYRLHTGIKPPYTLSVYQLTMLEKFGPITNEISEDQLDLFRGRLEELLARIRKKATAEGSVMEVCTDTGNCTYCDFNKYCRRVRDGQR